MSPNLGPLRMRSRPNPDAVPAAEEEKKPNGAWEL